MTLNRRTGTVLAAASIAVIIAGCAGPGGRSSPRSASLHGGKADQKNLGLATRSLMALGNGDIAGATDLSEQAVANSPRDAATRALLGNCYLAGGRFASAETAYRDSLSLVGNQPQIALKLALVQIAQGKSSEARALLAEAQSIIDPVDIGLALALAGDVPSAVQILTDAARQPGADARTRQNLALAHAFAGDWVQARTIASQDLPADQLEARVQQWMAMADPTKASQQVAALIGVTRAASDPGQPVRLALNPADDAVRAAAAQPVEAAPSVASVEPAPAPIPVEVAVNEPMAPPAPPIDPPAYEPAAIRVARPALSSDSGRLTIRPASLRHPAVRSGKSSAVVQLGAYSKAGQVSQAWAKVTARHASLKAFQPVRARFSGAQGTVYRLSVKGFASQRDAAALCAGLKRAGGNCFVRTVAGDAPVRIASR